MLAYVVKLSADYSRLKTKLETSEHAIQVLQEANEKQDRMNSAKFTELFNARNKTVESLAELTTTIKLLVSNNDKHFESIDRQFEKLDKKIEELREAR